MTPARGTRLPDRFPRYLSGRYRADALGVLTAQGRRTSRYTPADTAGCSAAQIIAELGLGRGPVEKGLARGILRRWVADH
jgi:hypothetical protein